MLNDYPALSVPEKKQKSSDHCVIDCAFLKITEFFKMERFANSILA